MIAGRSAPVLFTCWVVTVLPLNVARATGVISTGNAPLAFTRVT